MVMDIGNLRFTTLLNVKTIATVDGLSTSLVQKSAPSGACNDQLTIKACVTVRDANNTERKMDSSSDPKETKARWSRIEQWGDEDMGKIHNSSLEPQG